MWQSNSCKIDTKLCTFTIANKPFIWFTSSYRRLFEIKIKIKIKRPLFILATIASAAYSSQKKSLFLRRYFYFGYFADTEADSSMVLCFTPGR